mmetsp:Transcript_22571/g.45300  ORF Transcript_22571/g.45300 Transcript_22571/m.45300 type:complete len:92 (-) Transcript_22571:439-714(-)
MDSPRKLDLRDLHASPKLADSQGASSLRSLLRPYLLGLRLIKEKKDPRLALPDSESLRLDLEDELSTPARRTESCSSASLVSRSASRSASI